MKMSVLSWNIWQGQHLVDVLDFLGKNATDIIGLQEIIEKDGTNTAQIIADKLHYHCVYCRAVDQAGHGFPQGNAILSKYPIEDSAGHFLSDVSMYQGTAETEPRIAVEAKIKVGNTSLTVFTTHLAYSHKFQNSKFRDVQVENLIKLLPESKSLLMGDFNSYPDSSYMTRLNQVMKNADVKLTEPTWTMYPFDYEGFQETELRHRLDYIFTSKDLLAKDFRVGDSMGSDHLPLLATIEG